MQRFQLVRHEDVSGSSGTGIVAEGLIFSDGAAVMRWLTRPCSTAFYACLDDITRIHGHEGRSKVRLLDTP